MSTHVTAKDLGIDLSHGEEPALFQWLIASFLMGKRIQREIAAEAFRVIVFKHQRDTPRKLATCTQRDLVRMLGEARYTRYDESTAERLRKLGQKLNDEYGGQVLTLRENSADVAAFSKQLLTFDGIGPKTVEIFLREAEAVLF